ncbi:MULTISPECIES: hypothetical protein [unclassified Microcoleus]|uniref:hypothetical protein n=1 Tax=unclassified Microcoleus TaxID=2642155 RepID=UPI002FD2FDEA
MSKLNSNSSNAIDELAPNLIHTWTENLDIAHTWTENLDIAHTWTENLDIAHTWTENLEISHTSPIAEDEKVAVG